MLSGRATPAHARALSSCPGREGTGPETGGKVFDPWGLSKIASAETLAWYRACELKHGRVAMMACGGFIVQGAGIHFPG